MTDLVIHKHVVPGITKFGEVLVSEAGIVIRNFECQEWNAPTLRDAALNWALDEIRRAIKDCRDEDAV